MTTLKNRAEAIRDRALQLKTTPIFAKAAAAESVALDTSGLLIDMADRLDNLTDIVAASVEEVARPLNG